MKNTFLLRKVTDNISNNKIYLLFFDNKVIR